MSIEGVPAGMVCAPFCLGMSDGARCLPGWCAKRFPMRGKMI